MVSLCYHVQREGCGFWEAEWDSLMITSGAGHNYLLLTLHGLSEAQKTGQSLCCPLLKIITQKTAIKTLPAVSSSSSPWHSLYHFSSKRTVSTLKSTYSLLLSSLVNLYFSSCWFAQSKILLVQCGVHAGISSVINPKLDWKDHCQFGVCVPPRLGREKNACPTWPGSNHFRFLGSCSAFFRWNCLNNNNSRLLCWTSFCSQQNAFWVSFYLLVHRRKIHPVPCHRKKGEKHGICLHHVRVWVLYSKNIK